MKKHLIRLAVASLLLPGALNAGDWGNPGKGIAPLAAPAPDCNTCLSYDYIDLEYLLTDFGTPYFDDGGGYAIGFSKSLGCNFFFTGSFADGSYDWVGHFVPVDTQRFRLGLGARASIGECVDLTFEGGAQHLDAEFGAGYSDHDYDSWGYCVGPGIRARAGRFEAYGKILFVSNEGDNSREYLSHHTTVHRRVDRDGWLFTPGVIFHLNDVLAFKAGAEINVFDTAFSLGARFPY
ncbi:MAG: hypothetical protein P1U81_13255 [Verrucomicrobiales bacterium]|nr:hypothetical protein [Verrucomicrobiales bacterium]